MYCTPDDIIFELTERIAAQLTNSSEPDVNIITSKILEAEGYINSQIKHVYELPLKGVPTFIRTITIDLVKYLMKKQRVSEEQLKSIIESVNERLAQVSDGTVSLEGEVRINPFMVYVGSTSILTNDFWKYYDN